MGAPGPLAGYANRRPTKSIILMWSRNVEPRFVGLLEQRQEALAKSRKRGAMATYWERDDDPEDLPKADLEALVAYRAALMSKSADKDAKRRILAQARTRTFKSKGRLPEGYEIAINCIGKGRILHHGYVWVGLKPVDYDYEKLKAIWAQSLRISLAEAASGLEKGSEEERWALWRELTGQVEDDETPEAA